MVERHGIILIDEFEVILRIYEISDDEWRLHYYYSKNFVDLKAPTLQQTISKTFAILLNDHHTQEVNQWRLCARSAPNILTNEIVRLIGAQIERLNQQREQELLCKGLFTELW